MEENKEKILQEEKSAEEAAEAMRETMKDTADIVCENAEKAEEKVPESMEKAAESTDKALESKEQAVNASAEPQKKQKVPFGQKVKNAFSPKNLVKTIVVIVAILVVIGAAIGVLNYFSPSSVTTRFVKARLDGNILALEKVMAFDLKAYLLAGKDEESFFEAASNRYYEDISSWQEYNKAYMKYVREDLEDEIGKYKITQNVTREQDLSYKKMQSELGDIYLRQLEHLYDYNADAVKKCLVVTDKIRLDGEDETDKIIGTVYLVKMGMNWKVIDWSFDYQ